MLLVASYFFYAFYQPALLLLIVLTTLISWLASRRIEKTDNKTPANTAIESITTTAIKISIFVTSSYYAKIFSTMPPNPINANETKEAAINVTAKPLKGAGILLSSMRERKPENSTIANKKPKPQPKELTIDSTKE